MVDIWSPLTTHWAVNREDSDPRVSRIDTIQHHHAAGTNKWSVLSLFAPGGRTVTPNYFIAGKEIWGIVPENRRAWTSGSYVDDQRSITYEILNATGPDAWRFAQDTLETVVRLDRDISKRYGIKVAHSLPGFIEHRDLYEWFGRSYPTACAGPSFNINDIIARVKNTPAPEDNDDTSFEEDFMGVQVIARLHNGKVTEWSLLDPAIGKGLEKGTKDVTEIVDGSGNKHQIIVRPGLLVTTSPTVGDNWSRTHCRYYGSVPTRLERNNYVVAQNAAEILSLESQTYRIPSKS